LEEECASANNHNEACDGDAFSSGGKILVRIFGKSAEAVHERYQHYEVDKEVKSVV
jgi:hypothetical protein